MAPNPFYSNTSYYATVTEDVEQGGWTHTLAICMLRGTKQVLLVTDVSVIYGLFGNIGGALSLVVMLYGCLYTIKAYSPEVSTEFQIKGVDTLQYILSLFARLRRCSWHCKDRAAQTFKPLTLQGPGSTSTPTLITGRQQLMLSQNHHVAV